MRLKTPPIWFAMVYGCGCRGFIQVGLRVTNTPRVGSAVWCTHHQRVTLVQSRFAEFVTRCCDCRYTRPHGASPSTARLKARKHASEKQHYVEVWHGVRKLDTIGPDHPRQLALSEPPPF